MPDWSNPKQVRVSTINGKFVAESDGVVYDSDNRSEAINAAFNQSAEEFESAFATSVDPNKYNDWLTIEMVGDGVSWYARPASEHTAVFAGDTPADAGTSAYSSIKH